MAEKAMLKFYEGKIHDVAPDILTEFHPWMESVFFKADGELIERSKAAVKKLEPERKDCPRILHEWNTVCFNPLRYEYRHP